MINHLRYLKRNNFFAGRLLTAADLNLEQEYFREKLKRHNRYLRGFGVVFGLEVSKRSTNVIISQGLAIDCVGNELVVPGPASIPLPDSAKLGETVFVSLEFAEREIDPAQVPANDSQTLNASIEEISSIVFLKQNANSGHRHIKGRWVACGQTHGLVIARLRFGSNQWRIDRRYRRPFVK